MKKISVCIPTYNEEDNVIPAYEKVSEVLKSLNSYDYEIIFEDNDSRDKTQEIIRGVCKDDKKVKAIFNESNYGPTRSNKNCLYNSSGDAIITLPCDLQEPPEMIPEFVSFWEQGNKVVWGQKTGSEENKVKFFLRKVYYSIIRSFSEVEQYNQTTGFGLMDREVIESIKKYDDLKISYRHLIPELGYHVKLVPYTQRKRQHGKSSYSISRYYDFAITSFVRTSLKPIRIVTLIGGIVALLSLIVGFVYLVLKLLFWKMFAAGQAPIVISVFFLGAVQLFVTGILGEYIGIITERITKRPFVIEKERINFD